MIKIIKKKQNPNLQGEQFNQEFIDSLYAAIYQPTVKKTNEFISNALVSLNIGHGICDDCKENWQNCTCEYCDECKQRICACDRNTLDKSRKYIIHLLIKYLPYNDQYKFLQYLKSLNDDLIIVYNDKSLEKYIKILENKLTSQKF